MKKLILSMAMLLTMATSAFAQIGSLSSDLVFTPITPCRIVDTRFAPAGQVMAGSTRIFKAWAANYTTQGGSATNCNILQSNDVAALALNLLVITPAGEGFIKAWPVGAVQPNASTLNYKANDVLANSATLKVSQVSGDWNLYSVSTTHFVADVVGYYSKPVVTALECVETANTNLDIVGNGGTGNADAPACATGYTQTATNCETTSWLMPIVFFQSGTCSARNGDVATRTLRASRTCCRIPGR
jgi:hypothetical protein